MLGTFGFVSLSLWCPLGSHPGAVTKSTRNLPSPPPPTPGRASGVHIGSTHRPPPTETNQKAAPTSRSPFLPGRQGVCTPRLPVLCSPTPHPYPVLLPLPSSEGTRTLKAAPPGAGCPEAFCLCPHLPGQGSQRCQTSPTARPGQGPPSSTRRTPGCAHTGEGLEGGRG